MNRFAKIVWLLVFLSVPMWLQDQYFLQILIVSGIFIIAAMSLNLLLGYTGQLSLGHIAFFGVGAYASSLTSVGFDVELFGLWHVVHKPWPAIVGLFIGTAVAGLCGYLIGKLSFKVRGAYFIIVTLSFAEVTRLVALNWVELTQGPMAINNIPPITVGLPSLGYVALWSKAHYYYLVLFVAIVAYVVIARIVGSGIGRAMIALKENESLALSVGIDVTHYLVLGAVVSAALAGAAGSLYAHYIKIIDPDVFHFTYTVTMMIMVITGGKGTLTGPIVGGLIFGFLPVAVRSFAGPEVQWIIYGVLMIVIVFLLPQGIVPAISQWAEKLWCRPRDDSRPALVGLTPVKKVDRRVGEAGNSKPTLSLEHVSVNFGGLRAVIDLSFGVRDGEVVGLIGPNGAGKTTVFNAITGFVRSPEGRIAYKGVDLNGLKTHQIAALGLVRTFQRTSVFTNNTVFQNALIGLHRQGRPRLSDTLLALPREKTSQQQLVAEAWELLRIVGLEQRASHPAESLPYGEQRLVGVALALAAKPSMLLLDEPVSGMNQSETTQFMKLIERIRVQGITILLVEHDMRMVMSVSDRIIVLNHGQVIAEGPPASVQRNAEVVRAYLGGEAARA